MKTVFIINPKAGQGKGIDKLKERIREASERTGVPAGIYITRGPGDARNFARIFTEETMSMGKQGEERPGRLIACGGDGTLNEVLNGVLAAQLAAETAGTAAGIAGTQDGPATRTQDGSRVAIGVLPIGTGNDFVRNFPEAGDFLDPAAQLQGTIVSCDAIRYRGEIDGQQQILYCANMFNIGFDCNVVDMAARLKTYPLVAGSFAYLLAVAVTFVKKKGARLKVELDGKLIEDGQVLLTAIGNGGFCGGGVHSSPYACLQDGRMEVNVIYNVKRLDFLKKFPYYAKGTYNELPDIDRIIRTGTCERARITPLDGTMRLCTDGEITDAGTVDFEMVPGAFDMVLPL